jgi:hypothetical protein
MAGASGGEQLHGAGKLLGHGAAAVPGAGEFQRRLGRRGRGASGGGGAARRGPGRDLAGRRRRRAGWQRRRDGRRRSRGGSGKLAAGGSWGDPGWVGGGLGKKEFYLFIFRYLGFLIQRYVESSPSQQIMSPQLLQIGPACQFPHQFGINSKSVPIASNFKKGRSFLRLKRKVVVFWNFILNVVVLC